MSLAEHLLTTNQLKIKELKLIPSYGGVFEVTIDGELVHSKRQTGRFPTNEEIQAKVAEKLGQAT